MQIDINFFKRALEIYVPGLMMMGTWKSHFPDENQQSAPPDRHINEGLFLSSPLMLKVLYFLLLFTLSAQASAQVNSAGATAPLHSDSERSYGHIDSAVTRFKQGRWQQVVAMFDSILNNNYFTNNQLYYAVSKSLEQLSRETPEPARKDSLLQASRKVYQESVDVWGDQVMKGGADLQVYTITEKAPEPQEGFKKFNHFISSQLEYPETDLNEGREGKVYLQFIVNKDGSVDAIKVLRGLSRECDAEAVRLLSMSHRWTPGYQHGEAVFVKMVMPVTFSIHSYHKSLKGKSPKQGG